MNTRIVIVGAKGRMGLAVAACADRMADIEVAGRIDVGDDLASVIDGADVIVDFSLHTATLDVAQTCVAHRKPLVLGTTGHDDPLRARIGECASLIPLVWAANFSTGVNTLFWLVRQAARILGPAFDLEIVEMHHRLKKDAPSGTALSLARILAQARQQSLEDTLRHGRHGITGERGATEIGMHSLRGGDVVGDHTVVFAAAGERLELTHRATSRDTFALGALRAARWIVGKPPGRYDMEDVLGLKER